MGSSIKVLRYGRYLPLIILNHASTTEYNASVYVSWGSLVVMYDKKTEKMGSSINVLRYGRYLPLINLNHTSTTEYNASVYVSWRSLVVMYDKKTEKNGKFFKSFEIWTLFTLN